MPERYKIVEGAAGEGGYGRVDKAIDTELEREVAIKTLDPVFKVEPSAEDIERFKREAKTLARLSNPHIPAIYDVRFSEAEQEFKIIFEWIDGVSLRESLQTRGVLSFEDARRLFVQISSALEEAHSSGVIHRDIKPANIILKASADACYLVDFGISLREDELIRVTDGTPVGTPGYMSPEQERGEDLTPASDVFSLGVLLYECLAGTKPSVGGYKALSILNESIPQTVDTLVQEALRQEPEHRPHSAKAFIDRLSKALQPHASFAATLVEGSLQEIQLALNQMDPAGFAALPPGQREVVMSRLIDLVNVDEERMRNAVAALLTELIRVGHLGKREHYEQIVRHTMEYAYQKQYGEAWHGNAPAREALNSTSLVSGSGPHLQIAEEALALVARIDLKSKPKWYLHDLRVLLNNLCVNSSCSEGHAEKLGAALRHVNEVSHKTTA